MQINPDPAGALAGWQLACTAVHFSRRKAYRLPLCFGPLWNLKVHRKMFQLEWPIPQKKCMQLFHSQFKVWREYLLSNLRTRWKNVDAAISVVKTPVIGFRSLILVITQGWHSTHIHWIINFQHPTSHRMWPGTHDVWCFLRRSLKNTRSKRTNHSSCNLRDRERYQKGLQSVPEMDLRYAYRDPPNQNARLQKPKTWIVFHSFRASNWYMPLRKVPWFCMLLHIICVLYTFHPKKHVHLPICIYIYYIVISIKERY